MEGKKVGADTNFYNTLLVVSKLMEQFFNRGDTIFFDTLFVAK